MLSLDLLCKLIDFLSFFSVFEPQVVEKLFVVVVNAVGKLVVVKLQGFILMVIVYGLSVIKEFG